MKRTGLVAVLALLAAGVVSAAGAAESAGSASRGAYLAGQGVIVPPEEVYVDSYIAQIDYGYADPTGDLGAYLYTSNQQVSRHGQEAVLHIGLQGRRRAFADLPPLNLSFVVDVSASMAEANKLEWVKESFNLFIDRVRDGDILSLVAFGDTPEVLIPSQVIRSPEDRDAFRSAVAQLTARGGSDIASGLEAGYEQIMRNYRADYTNRVLFLSDGTEISTRLSRAGGQTGAIRATLIWNNRNDLDLHMITPSGEEIYYGHSVSVDGGLLDVDMNVRGETTKPVENIFWPEHSTPVEGTYRVFVRNYGYHEDAGPTEFTVELKHGNEVSQFTGTVDGTGAGSDVTAFEFTYAQASERKAEIYQIAEQYRHLGVNVSTIGVGTGFDLDLMTTLAREGGGSSRFISDREKMQEIFGDEFDRMVVPAARSLEMQLTLHEQVELLGTWGYAHQVDGNQITYTLTTLHNRDYETILVRYRLSPQMPLGRQTIATFTVNYQSLSGEPRSLPEHEITLQVVDTQDPISGYSDGTVLYSGSMMDFALRLMQIGDLYYTAREDAAATDLPELPEAARQKLSRALELTRLSRAELENAQLRLDTDAFATESEILVQYERILNQDLGMRTATTQNGEPDGDVSAVLPTLSTERSFEQHLASLTEEMVLGFAPDAQPTLAVAGFTAPGDARGALLDVLNNALTTSFAGLPQFTMVDRGSLERVLEEQELSLSGLMDTTTAVRVGNLLSAAYIVTGNLIETTESVIIFARIVNVETGTIESAAQTVVSKKSDITRFL